MPSETEIKVAEQVVRLLNGYDPLERATNVLVRVMVMAGWEFHQLESDRFTAHGPGGVVIATDGRRTDVGAVSLARDPHTGGTDG